MSFIRAVLGDLVPSELGATDYHEHLFQASPLLTGEDLDSESASRREADLLRDSGFAAMVDATPIGLGRWPEAVARISAATGLTVIASTGVHREAHYPADHWLRELTADALTARFVAEILDALPARDGGSTARATTPGGESVRAGLIKTGIGYWSISPFERRTLEAAAEAHARTGAPVMVHLEFCTAAHEVLDLLAADGVALTSVALAHADRDPNPALHLELADRGAWLGYDGMARPRTRSEAELLDLTAVVVAAGGGNRVLLGGDVARRSRYVSYGGMPGLGYLGNRYLPALRSRVGDAAVRQIISANPARYLTFAEVR